MLHSFCIRNALDLRDAPEHWIKSTLSVVGQRIWYELHGVSCLQLEQFIPAKKGICSSRSFTADVTKYETLKEAVSNHAARCAEKLRKQKSETSLLCVFISTNRFALQSQVAGNTAGQSAGNQVKPRLNKPVKASQSIKLSEASSYSSLLIQYALKALEAIYENGQAYKKAGVYVSGIAPESVHQHTLFATTDRDKQQKAMTVMDEINQKMGKNTLKLAAMGFQKPGLTFRGRLSPRWDELMVINCL